MMNDDTSTGNKKNGGCCAFTQKHQIGTILLFAILGVGLGVGLSFWEPDNSDAKKMTLQWIGLIGDLFLRALKCFVLPLVFVNVIIAVVDMMMIGKASSIGWTVIGLYLTTTVAAAVSYFMVVVLLYCSIFLLLNTIILFVPNYIFFPPSLFPSLSLSLSLSLL
jgi:L-cystine uptake protein TcyP (sodium:dicarboxylate symporter family)